MIRYRAAVLFALLGAASLLVDGDPVLAGTLPPASATQGFKLEWTRRSLGSGIGQAGLVVADLDGDGRAEIVTTTITPLTTFDEARYWTILAWDGAGGYKTTFDSPMYSRVDQHLDVNMSALIVAQLDQDPALEIVVGFPRKILVYDGATHQLEATIPITARTVLGLQAADLDGDGALEFVFHDGANLYILDAATGATKYVNAFVGLDFLGLDFVGPSLAVGNVDSDPALEIVVASKRADHRYVGYVIDGVSHALEWKNEGDFGDRVRIADLDGDGRGEIVSSAWEWQSIRVIDPTRRVVAASYPVSSRVYAMRLFDLDGDGHPEILLGHSDPGGGVQVLDGRTGALRWQLPIEYLEVNDLAAGDTDGDGIQNVVWGAGWGSSFPALYVASHSSQAVEWRSDSLNGYFHALAAGDVDADGTRELLYGSVAMGEAVWFVHDAVTKRLEHQQAFDFASYRGLSAIRTANVDSDPQLELFFAVQGYPEGIVCYDGLDHHVQWRATLPGGSAARALRIADLDGDGSLEIVALAGVHDTFVHVLDAATGALEWTGPNLGYQSSDTGLVLRVANLDADPRPEIVIGGANGPNNGSSLHIIDGVTRALRTLAVPRTTALDTADRDGDGRSEIVIASTFMSSYVQVIDSMSGAVLETVAQVIGSINALAVAPGLNGGPPRYFVAMQKEVVVFAGSSSCPAARTGEFGDAVGYHDSMLLEDVDGDGRQELFVSAGATGVSVFEVEPPSLNLCVYDTAGFEGSGTSSEVVFTLELSAPATAPVTVSYQTADSTAVAPGDYEVASGTATFGVGDTRALVHVPLVSDTTWEPDEIFILDVSGPGWQGVRGYAGIRNDDGIGPRLSISPADIDFGPSQSQVATTRVVTLTNTGDTPLVGVATVTGEGFSLPGPIHYEIPACTSQDVTVAFTPTAGRTYYAGRVSFTGDRGSTEPARGIAIRGSSNTAVSTTTWQTRTGSPVTATVVNAPGNTTDWVGLFRQSDSSNAAVDWKYLNGSRVAPATALRTATLTFTMPTTPGYYVFRLFENNIYNSLATSSAFDVRPIPVLSVGNMVASEGNSGYTLLQLSVSLNAPADVPVSVHYATADSSATAGSDYVGTSGDLSFAPGQTSKTFTVTINGDTQCETDETFFVNLSAASGAPIATGQAVITIQNEDAGCGPLACPSTVSPGAPFPVTVLGGATPRDWVALYAASASSASVPANWRYVPLPRPQTQTFTAPNVPGNYQLRLFANDGFGVVGTCPFTVAVVPTLTIGDLSVPEGHSGTTTANFTVTLAPAAPGTVTVDFATANGSAQAASDYAAINGTLTFLAGQTTKTISVNVTGDTVLEPNETFFVNLSGASSNAAIGDAQGQGTIIDDDAPPVLSCPATVNPGASFSAAVTGGSSSLDWIALYAASASVPANWRYVPMPRPQTQTFMAPSTPGSYQLRLFANDGFSVVGTCSFTVAVVPTLTIGDAAVAEGHSGTKTASFAVTLAPAASGTVTVSFATADGSALAASDYAATSGTLTFLAGETTKTVSILVNGDVTLEPNESFFVNLSLPTGGAVIGDGQGQGMITDDDAPPLVACPALVSLGTTFTVTFNGGSSPLDWAALYAVGAANTTVPANWRYVPLPRPRTQTFSAPGTPGNYEVRLLANDGFSLVGSCSLAVTSP